MTCRLGQVRASKPIAIGCIAVGLLLLGLVCAPTFMTQAAPQSSALAFPLSSVNLAPMAAVEPARAAQSLDPVGPHGGYGALTDQCTVCHRGHTSQGRDLTQFWPEEALCFSCHSAGGSAETDLLTLFQSVQNTTTAFFGHPVTEISGAHDTPLEVVEEDLSDRHAECADCHNPHQISSQDAAAPALSGMLAGVAGVEPVFDGPGSPTGYTWLSTAYNEYQVCFRCHSTFTVLPSYIPDGWSGNQIVSDGLAKLTNTEAEQVPDSRNLAREFNPAQASYHPVLAQGRNQAISPYSFVGDWSVGSYTYCSDCHATQMASDQSAGPHAGQLHILKESSPYVTVNDSGGSRLNGNEVCFNCHRAETYLNAADPIEYTNFRRNNRNLHQDHASKASCYQCHDTHGSEQRHLLNLDTRLNDQNPRLLQLAEGYDGQPTNSQTFWQISPDGTTKTCFIYCHNRNHTQPGMGYPNFAGE